MKDVATSDVRSFVIMGHTGSGKTVLTDALLVKLGVAKSAGSVDAGTSISDYTDEEKERKISLYATPFTGEYQAKGDRKVRVFLIDTPGYDDFYGQVVAASRVAGAGVIVVDAGSGLQIGSLRAWQRAGALGLPTAVVVTGLDKENTDFGKTVAQIQEAWGKQCVPVGLPLADGSGVLDVLGGKDIPADQSDELATMKEGLVELAAETDDSLIEKYLGGEGLSTEELSNGLQSAVADGKLVPIFPVIAAKDIGVTELLEGVAALFPSPAAAEVACHDGAALDVSPDAPLVGLVWRTLTDPFAGQLAYVRVYSGTLTEGTDLANASKNGKEKAGAVLVINGQKQEPVPEAGPGDLVALAKLKDTQVGDVLCASGHKAVLAPIEFPNPVMSFAIRASKQGEADKVVTALQKAAGDDPTIRLERTADTKELVISGMGDIHLETVFGIMRKRSNVSVELSTPKVPYRETVTGQGEGHYRHKKQTGGRGQYAEVFARVGPKQQEEEEWFEDAIFGGAIPRNFIPAVQKGFVEAMAEGAVAGYPVVNTKATVYDGSFHEVDSSEIAFKIAASRAFRDAMSKAKPVLLEPIMTVEVTIPEQYMGDVNGDLNQKRGRILGVNIEAGMQVISAEVPQAELFRYASELRSMTGGRGAFQMSFSRYEVVPSNIAQKIVSAKGAKEEA